MRRYYKPLSGHAQLDLIAKTALLNQRLGNANAARITNTCEFDSHRSSSNYIVITGG